MLAKDYYAYLAEARRKKDTLQHYGIAGQKWGIRRWQYEDGKFNEEGKIRYFGSSGKEKKEDNSKDYLAEKEEHTKYLKDNYDNDFAQVQIDDEDTSGEWLSQDDLDKAYQEYLNNPYEYLKKYSRDPKYNLSPKEEKKLQKEAKKIDKAFFKNDIGALDLIQSDKTEQIRKDTNESFNKNCIEELNKLKDLYKDYEDDPEKYYAITGFANALTFGNEKLKDISLIVHGYVYDDFDQGSGNSGYIYLLDKGYSKDDITNMCKTNYKNNEKFKDDIELSINKDPLMSKTDKRVKIQLRNALHQGSRSDLINKDVGDYDEYSYKLQESGDTPSDYSNRIKQNLSEAKKLYNKVGKTCSSKEYGWWYLNQAINELGYSDISYKDLTDSDWNRINEKVKELS